eukprot:gene30210-39416_t
MNDNRNTFSRLSRTYSTAESSSVTIQANNVNENTRKLYWNIGDALDKKILILALPAVLNNAILPLVGAADTFWVGRMKNALTLAGQGAANQAHGSGDSEAVQDRVGEALFLGSMMGLLGMGLLTVLPEKVLALTFVPALISTVAFASFRGTLDIMTPLRIAIISNIVNVVLDPFMIFSMGMGVAGAAAATCVSEIISCVIYGHQLLRKNMVSVKKLLRFPSMSSLSPLLISGLSVQMRAVALNIAFLAVTRTTQQLDSSGTAAAAHAITVQLWQLGGVVLLAMSTVASIIVPSEVAKAKKEAQMSTKAVDLREARFAADRLLQWGVVLGALLGSLQLLCLPLLNVFSPLQEVQSAARLPSIIGALLQLINAIATVGMLTSLHFLGSSLAGVWGSFAAFNLIRLSGVLRHHFFAGPLAKAHHIHKEESKIL